MPVSDSGKLRQYILRQASDCPFAPADAFILDACSRSCNPVRYITDTQLAGYPFAGLIPDIPTAEHPDIP